MPDPRNSPAVQSMEIEQAEQREGAAKDGLDTGLEDSFPALDPISATHSAVPPGRADADEADRVRQQRAETDEELPSRATPACASIISCSAPSLRDRLQICGIDKFARSWEHTSDHAPVWIELDDD